MLKTFSPAVLVIGLNLDPPGIRAVMVNAESLAHVWTGVLKEDTARARRLNRCLGGRCLQPLQIIAAPDSEAVTIVLGSGTVTLTLTMHRDPDAHADKPLKPMRSR